MNFKMTRDTVFVPSLIVAVYVPAEEHGGTPAQDVESSTLLLNQRSTLGGETAPLPLRRGLDSTVVLLVLKLRHG
ncbi:hypothetical protein V6N12_029573 [Hibiscus sabdariffa]|uniref:Uncharacterized protein n=1 Tax=Hibiscus sabdariffa TaxID=183260 RepID=A0ABR2CWK9_9ROSI